MTRKRPNPFKPRTMIWALYEEDWSDLTVPQIAEVFGMSESYVYSAIRRIWKLTGYRVPYRVPERGISSCK